MKACATLSCGRHAPKQRCHARAAPARQCATVVPPGSATRWRHQAVALKTAPRTRGVVATILVRSHRSLFIPENSLPSSSVHIVHCWARELVSLDPPQARILRRLLHPTSATAPPPHPPTPSHGEPGEPEGEPGGDEGVAIEAEREYAAPAILALATFLITARRLLPPRPSSEFSTSCASTCVD